MLTTAEMAAAILFGVGATSFVGAIMLAFLSARRALNERATD